LRDGHLFARDNSQQDSVSGRILDISFQRTKRHKGITSAGCYFWDGFPAVEAAANEILLVRHLLSGRKNMGSATASVIELIRLVRA
jgi:hypothetical protein